VFSLKRWRGRFNRRLGRHRRAKAIGKASPLLEKVLIGDRKPQLPPEQCLALFDLQALPVDVIMHILSFLSVKDLLRMEATNSFMKSLVHKVFKTMHHLIVDDFPVQRDYTKKDKSSFCSRHFGSRST